MDMTLRLCNQTVNRYHIVFNLFGKGQMLPHNMLNVVHSAVVMMFVAVLVVMMVLMHMFMVMIMFVLMLMMVLVHMLMVMIMLMFVFMFVFMMVLMYMLMVAVIMMMFVFMLMIVVMVMFMLVVMVMAFLFHAAHCYGNVGPGDAAFYSRFLFYLNTGQSQPVQLPDKGVGVVKQLHQGGGKHVSRGSHSAVQI